MCSVQRWNQFQNYLIKSKRPFTLQTFGSVIGSGMNADTCILRLVCDSHLARQIVNGKIGGPLNLHPYSHIILNFSFYVKILVCVKSKIIIFFFIYQINTCHWCIFLTLKHNIMTSIRNSPVFEVNGCIQE